MSDQSVNYLEMSDEELLKAEVPTGPVDLEAAKPTTDEEGAETTTTEATTTADPAAETEGAAHDVAEAKPDATEVTATKVEADEVKEPTKEEVKTDEVAKVEAEKTPTEAKPDETKPSIDFEAEYNRLLAPFKANGREVQVKSVDDAIALMQMGANYNKKMAGLKPNLKMLKMLENNGLLSEDKLAFLIALDKKDPEAIQKLVKESGINPVEIDVEKPSTFTPKVQAVDDREVELDSVLDDIQGTPSYNRTVAIVSKEWDSASKQVIASSPQLLKVINDHVDRGIYDIISREVESERMLGRLAGLSDIEAYRQVGDAINARGGFNHLGAPQAQKTTPAAATVVPTKPRVSDEKLKEQRRAAAPAKPTAPAAVPKDFNPLALSDEEFAKMAAPKYA